MMIRAKVRSVSLLGFALAMAACNEPPRKPAPDLAASAPPLAAKSSEPSRVGTVGLIREIKDRGMTMQNWPGIIGSIFTNEADKDVIRVRYEVTIFYKEGGQGVVLVDERPGVETGQRVRVIGDRIEPLDR